jgi:hypothetical protein
LIEAARHASQPRSKNAFQIVLESILNAIPHPCLNQPPPKAAVGSDRLGI